MKIKNKYTLLCAEDSLMSRKMIVEYLEDDFFEIYEASNGEEALVVYEEKNPSIIISDLNMPKMNGLQLIKKIRKTDKETPIIMLTAYTDMEYLLEAIELNLIKYLIKPLNEEKLDEALEVCKNNLENNTATVVKLTEKHFYDFCNSVLISNDEIIPLPHAIHKFLSLLIENKHRMVSYEEIENSVWKDKIMTDSALRSLIYNIRKKISPNIIENISKQGYKIKLYE